MKSKENLTKIGFNVNDELLGKIDKYADSLHINRSAALCVLISQAFEYREIVEFASKYAPELIKLQEMQERENREALK